MTGKKIFGIILIIAAVLLHFLTGWAWWIKAIILVVGVVFLLCKGSVKKPVDVKEEIKTEPVTEEKPVGEAPTSEEASAEESSEENLGEKTEEDLNL